ncbi:MAG TPA: hypothetical protein VLZ31_05000 [Microbacteriaceae bacterium]|nr:hypothetical protein [Microbacteriaceae bacterium]
MGFLHLGASQKLSYDDRELAHLRYVITNKLMKQESFLFTWAKRGRASTVWVHPSIDLLFEFETDEKHLLNRNWIDLLTSHANSPGGLRIIEEPQ